MNRQLLSKIGPIAGLIISLGTTSFAGYKIYAAASEQGAVVPSLPSPTPSPMPESIEVVQTVVANSSETAQASGPTGGTLTPTSMPKASGATGASHTPSGASGLNFSAIAGTSGSIGRSGEDSFEDSDDDRISLEDHAKEDDQQKEGDHEKQETENQIEH